jgi:sulfur relay protein TusB/DsrH
VLSKTGASYYVLADDLEIRGYTAANVNSKVKVIGYGDIVDLIMNDYEKTAWL